VNATFKWIAENIRDNVDFVVWTGDSARHDSDEKVPRNQDEVLSTNRWIADKFVEVFGNDKDPDKALSVPIVPTFGNNDILPHNILLSGPNKWLKTYADIWSQFIPEEQRHGFERGGWYYVEVIPKKLAVFSLNTLYFFSHNAAVDGCALRSEPGYEHMEWLRIQLQFMRDRGMKAILTGHVPPARTDSKQLWDETCWQKYTLWLQQYRDVVVGGLYGHMNIDHFMLQDTKHVDLLTLQGQPSTNEVVRAMMEEELSIESANDYLEELREKWSDLPNPPAATSEFDVDDDDSLEDINKKKKGKKKKHKKALKKIGGPWGERFQVTNVGPSVVPNYFPTLRVIEYNITGLETTALWASSISSSEPDQMGWLDENVEIYVDDYEEHNSDSDLDSDDYDKPITKKKKKGKKHKKKPLNPGLIIPSPPSKSSPPGPAYSPQTLTMLGYTQYFANLTYLNNAEFIEPEDFDVPEDGVDMDKWHEGKHKGKHPKNKVPRPMPFQYQVEYDTFSDPVYKLKDMTVRSYIKLAHRIGQYKPEKLDEIAGSIVDDDNGDGASDNEDYEEHDNIDVENKKKKHHKQHEKNKVWLQFIVRAFVGTLEKEELQSFDDASDMEFPDGAWNEDTPLVDMHDGEL
jgi:endopolyphosphatase